MNLKNQYETNSGTLLVENKLPIVHINIKCEIGQKSWKLEDVGFVSGCSRMASHV